MAKSHSKLFKTSKLGEISSNFVGGNSLTISERPGTCYGDWQKCPCWSCEDLRGWRG